MERTLRDGTAITIRPIRADDKALIAWAVTHMSARSIYQRFLTPKPRLSNAELRYLTEVDHDDHEALVAVRHEEPRRIVGVARWIRDAEHPDTAEFAIVVGDPWQGKGAGSALARELVRAAREHGISHFTATVLSDNLAVQRLIAGIATQLEYRSHGGVREVHASLAA
jgi:RimJ/RimL family protein N-acetyltransferase